MISPGQTLENPVTGERFDLHRDRGDHRRRAARLRARPAARRRRADAAHAPDPDRAVRGRRGPNAVPRRMAHGHGRAGRRGRGRAGRRHGFANAGDGYARVRVEVRPALAMEEMFADVVEMAEAGRMTKRGMPRNLLDLALLARTYDQEAHAPLLGAAPAADPARAARVRRAAAAPRTPTASGGARVRGPGGRPCLAAGRAHRRRRPRFGAQRRRPVRLLVVRAPGASPDRARGRDPGDAVDQRPRADPRVHDRVRRHRPLSLALIAAAIAGGGSSTGYLVAGAVVYLVGVIGLTRAWNVPLNDSLAEVDAADPAAEAYWRRYLDRWLPANHVRSAAGVVGAGLMIGGLLAG